MTNRKNKILNNRFYNFFSINIKCISVFVLIFSFISCQSQEKYDPELMTPDIDNAGMIHGYNFTSLGCLLAFPWEYQGKITDTSIDSRMYGVTTEIKEQYKKDLVFELQRNGSLKFWFKRDYIVYPVDTVTQLDGIKTLRKIISKSENLKIKNIYTSGKWKVNFKDSTIQIDFGKNDFELNSIEGKYYSLNAYEMCIVKGTTIEIINGGEKKKMQARIICCFVH